MLNQTFLFSGQLWQLFEVSQILEFLRGIMRFVLWTKRKYLQSFGINGALPAVGNIKFLPGNYFTGNMRKKQDQGNLRNILLISPSFLACINHGISSYITAVDLLMPS